MNRRAELPFVRVDSPRVRDPPNPNPPNPPPSPPPPMDTSAWNQSTVVGVGTILLTLVVVMWVLATAYYIPLTRIGTLNRKTRTWASVSLGLSWSAAPFIVAMAALFAASQNIPSKEPRQYTYVIGGFFAMGAAILLSGFGLVPPVLYGQVANR